MKALESQIRNRSALASFMQEHEIEHAGQISTYFSKLINKPKAELCDKGKYLINQNLAERLVDKNTWIRIASEEAIRPQEAFSGRIKTRWEDLIEVIGDGPHYVYKNGPLNAHWWNALFGTRRIVVATLFDGFLWDKCFSSTENKHRVRTLALNTKQGIGVTRKIMLEYLNNEEHSVKQSNYAIFFFTKLVAMFRAHDVDGSDAVPQLISELYKLVVEFLNCPPVKSALLEHNVFNLVKHKIQELEIERLDHHPVIKNSGHLYGWSCERIRNAYLENPSGIDAAKIIRPPAEDLIVHIDDMKIKDNLFSERELEQLYLRFVDQSFEGPDFRQKVSEISAMRKNEDTNIVDLLRIMGIDKSEFKPYRTSWLFDPDPRCHWSRKVENLTDFLQVLNR